MAKDRHIWTVNSACYEMFSDDVKFRSESAYESLADVLHRIAIWSNMKTMQGYDIKIENDGVRNDETIFIARNESKKEYEEVILQRVTFHPKKTAES